MNEFQPMYGLLFDGRKLAGAGPMVMTRYSTEATAYTVMVLHRRRETVILPGKNTHLFLAVDKPSVN